MKTKRRKIRNTIKPRAVFTVKLESCRIKFSKKITNEPPLADFLRLYDSIASGTKRMQLV